MEQKKRAYPDTRRPYPREDEREEREPTAVGGRNAVRELLASGRDIDKIFVAAGDREGSITTLIAEARSRSIPVVEVDRRKLDVLCGHNRHQGIAANAAMVEYCELDDLFARAAERGESPFFVILDGIEDPHNLGAILRSAECCGAHGLILQKRRSAGITPIVAKASAGAVMHLPIARVTNLACTVDALRERGVWIYGADMDGTVYDSLDYRGASALVLGSEGFGISRLVREKCDFIASIPLYGKVNSMNVSAAAAVLLCEIARQRHKT